MKDKRYVRALIVALISSCIGLLCCVSVFYLFWGKVLAAQLLPVLIFLAALGPALIVCAVIIVARKNK
ncbi:MAG: hypothetical protein IJK89_03470 [Clostridia bacterium]|nr:hypothetical protein [Clostridia bacterium]